MLDNLTNYTFLNKDQILGEGGFSKVYLANKNSTGKQYAIKIVDISKLSKDDLANLNREISIHKSITHSNIIHFEEAVQKGSLVYLVLESAQNGCLYFYIHS